MLRTAPQTHNSAVQMSGAKRAQSVPQPRVIQHSRMHNTVPLRKDVRSPPGAGRVSATPVQKSFKYTGSFSGQNFPPKKIDPVFAVTFSDLFPSFIIPPVASGARRPRAQTLVANNEGFSLRPPSPFVASPVTRRRAITERALRCVANCVARSGCHRFPRAFCRA